MAYPTGTPVEEQVLDNLRDTLAAIGPPSFHHKVRQAERQVSGDLYETFKNGNLPGAIVYNPGTVTSNRVHGLLEHTMAVVVEVMLKSRETYATDIIWLVQDVTRALLADHTRGGTARDTAITGHEYLEPDPTNGFATANINVEVRYAHLYDDPNTDLA